MSTVYWIRRDFRLDDNPALFYALQQNCKHAVFITAYDTWREHNHSGIQVDFIERHLNWFSDQLTKGLLENGSKNFMQGIYLGYMYYRWRKIRDLDKDDPVEK